MNHTLHKYGRRWESESLEEKGQRGSEKLSLLSQPEGWLQTDKSELQICKEPSTHGLQKQGWLEVALWGTAASGQLLLL